MKENLHDSVYKLKNDISLLKQWILHLNYKNKEASYSHKSHVALTKSDMENLKAWIGYLNKHLTELGKSIRNLEQEHKKLTKKLEYFQQSKITSITSRNRDVIKSDTRSDTENDMQNDAPYQLEYSQLHDVAVSPSERRLITLLFSSERPLSYTQLAKKLNLNYGTVKNIIYKIRKSGLEIKSITNPEGEKEFFLTSKMKIQLSGR